MQIINYNALAGVRSKATNEKSNSFLLNPAKAQTKSRLIIIKVLALIFGGFLIIAILPGVWKYLTLAITLGGIYYYATVLSKKQVESVKQFVKDNGWSFADSIQLNVPSLSKAGDNYGISGSPIKGELEGVQFWLYTYSFGMGSNIKECVVISLLLQKTYPTITLDAGANNILGSSVINRPASRGLVEISLEGNFSQSFKAYMEPNQQIDVLSVITPDLMQMMIDQGSFFDIDIIGNYVHIISSNGLVVYPFIKKQIEFAQAVAAKLAS